MKSVSCIIPAYNEGRRIAQVIESVLESRYISEVIVVNDGSTDDTAQVVGAFSRIVFLDKPQNEGKSRAIYDGLMRATGEYILMLDSDLLWLRGQHVDALIEPILGGAAEVSISLRENSLRTYRFFGLDYVSGERVFPRSIMTPEVLQSISELRGFGLEVFLNELFLSKNYRICSIDLPGVISPRKSAKYGIMRGIFGDIRMLGEVLATMGPIDNVSQFIRMYRQLVR